MASLYQVSIDDIILLRRVAIFGFAFLDLATTFYGLSLGFTESAPGTYLFGSNLLIVMIWLTLQKIFAFLGLEYLLKKLAPKFVFRNLIFLYGLLFGLGLFVSLQNVKWIWRGG